MPTVQTRGGTLTYQDQGEGPVLILLHATLHSHHDFDSVAPILARDYRVIAPDWPGCGDSPRASNVSAPLFADALEDLVDHLGESRVLLIGNSVGGFAAARLAIDRPEQVAGLVLVQTGGFVPMNPVVRLLCRAMGTPALFKVLAPLALHAYMQPQSPLDHQIIARVAAAEKTPEGRADGAAMWRSFVSPEHDLRPRAAELTAPTLIIWGRRDRSSPLFIGRATHRAIEGSRFEVLDTGHVPFASAPGEFLDVVLPFLATVRERIA